MNKHKINEFTEIEVNKNVITMSHSLERGYEFQAVLNEIKDLGGGRTLINHTVNYIYDKEKNRRYKARRFTEKYSTWVTSYILKCRDLGIIQ